uniref:ATP synthase subunit a n=1 Tax=Erpobdella octoculata TaxID=39305 RepID=X2C9P3_9ANNE|nr:ATP synthase F0 subunit 6 [Erpobdella octoculata]AGL34607.1 ATP synthase F0 subunit 6 [Erpobdella octoculata]
MLMDIFSSFDSYQFNSFIIFNKTIIVLVMMVPFFMYFFLSSAMWLALSRIPSITIHPVYVMLEQTMRTKSKTLKGSQLILSALFLIIISMNLIGLVAFSFSLTSHLIFTLTFGLPLWLSSLSSSIAYNKKEFIAHLLPSGAPDWLNPFLVLIETVSISVRPLTLSFRLAATDVYQIAYRLITTSKDFFMNCFNIHQLDPSCMSVVEGLFEVGICMIQGYIFCLLLSLYTDDHS